MGSEYKSTMENESLLSPSESGNLASILQHLSQQDNEVQVLKAGIMYFSFVFVYIIACLPSDTSFI